MNDISFTLVQLQTFLAVAEQGSFSAAARSIDRAQSAVSHSIGQLENHLKVELFDRDGRTPQLTPAGHALLEDSRRLIRQARELELSAKQWSAAEAETHFSLVVDMIFPVEALVRILAALQRANPRLALTVHTEARGAVTARILDESCQLGVTGLLLPEAPSGVEALGLGAIDFVLVAAPSHPLAQVKGTIPIDALRQHTQIVLEDRSHLSTDQQVGVVGTNTWRIGGQSAKHSLLLAGFGWGNMPRHLVRQDIESGKLVHLHPAHWTESYLSVPLHVIYRNDRPPGPVATETIKLLQESAPFDQERK